MLTEPKLEQRAEQPYVAIRRQVTLGGLSTELPPLVGDVFKWIGQHQAVQSGPVFFRYLTMDMEGDGRFVVDVGVPLEAAVPGDGAVIAGAMPAGRYAAVLYTGPYDNLSSAHFALLEWGKAHGIDWQTSDEGRGWGARVEFYISDPDEEPDPQKWETEVAFLTAEG
jgi:effector-binding domain-containing protein